MGCQSSKTSKASKPEQADGNSKTLLDTKPVIEQTPDENKSMEEPAAQAVEQSPITEKTPDTLESQKADGEVPTSTEMDVAVPVAEVKQTDVVEPEADPVSTDVLSEAKVGPATEVIEQEMQPGVEQTKTVDDQTQADESGLALTPEVKDTETSVAADALPTEASSNKSAWSCMRFCQATEMQSEIVLDKQVSSE